METNDPAVVDQFVGDRLAAIGRDSEWEPDLEQGLARLHAQRQLRSTHGRRRAAAIALVVAAVSLTPPAWPVTRLVAAKCVDACVGVSNRVGQLFVPKTAKVSVTPAADGPAEGFVPASLRVAAPDFTLDDSAGHRVQLSALEGRVVLLNFWATWCGPCRVEMPAFNDLQRTYRQQGLVIVGVSMDEEGWAAVRPFLAHDPVAYPIVIGTDSLADRFGGVGVLPTTLLVDRQGRIAARHTGLFSQDDYERELRVLLD